MRRASGGPRPGAVEISAGGAFTGRMDLGATDAEQTRNINTGTGRFVLFSTASEVEAAPSAVVRGAVYLTRAVAIEAGFHYSRPRLSVRLSGDAEQAPAVTARETLSRYVVDGSLVLHLTGLSFAGGRGVPFLAGGGGYLRELHEQNELMQTGREYHAGGGVKLWMGSRRPRVGLRLDGGLSLRSGGADFSAGRRAMPTAGASILYLF